MQGTLSSRWLSISHLQWLNESGLSSFWHVGEVIQIDCCNLGIKIKILIVVE